MIGKGYDYLQKGKILYVPAMDFIVPEDNFFKELPFVPNIVHLSPSRVMVELYNVGGTFLGMLYYERAKTGFTRKPVGLKKMACVDAKIETLFILYPELTPKDVMNYCQELLSK